MSDLDTMIRDGLARAVDGVEDASVEELASRLAGARSRRRGPARHGPLLAAAVVVALVAAAVTVAVRSGGPSDELHTQPATVVPVVPTTRTMVVPPGPSGFVALGSGWHQLDTGPVPPMGGADLVWTGDRLIVVGDQGAFSYDPAGGGWSTIPAPSGLRFPTLVWTGTELVAVSWDGRAAALVPGAAEWHDLGAVPSAPGLVAAGSAGPQDASHTHLGLVWTGQRVIDTTHGAAFDPTTRRWSVLPMPEDLVPYYHLIEANPVWDGREVVVLTATNLPGLAWDAMGGSYRVVPGVPASVVAPAGLIPRSPATAVGSSVVMVTGREDGLAVTVDATTGAWTRLDPVPGVISEEGCPTGGIATVAGHAVMQPCTGDTLAILDGRTWRASPPNPDGQRYGRWASTGDALVVWSSDTDVVPFVRVQVWVP